MKIALNTLYYSLLGAAGLVGLVFAASLMPIPGNIEIKVVKSGSMEPSVHVGSIVIIKPEASYQVGDVITFGKDTKTQIPTTHRIVAVQGEGSSVRFETRGDANDAADNGTTPLSEVKGKMLLTVPYVGYALAFLRTKLGFMLLVGVPALLVFLEEGRVLFVEIRRLFLRRGRRKAPQLREVPVHTTEFGDSPRKVPVTSSDIRPRKTALLVIAAATVVGCATLGSAYGNTLALYSNSATSQGNVLRAAADFTRIAQRFAVEVSDVAVTDDETPQDDVEEPAAESEEEIPLEEPQPDPVVEVSTPVVVEVQE